jgi:hypothetical protein
LMPNIALLCYIVRLLASAVKLAGCMTLWQVTLV